MIIKSKIFRLFGLRQDRRIHQQKAYDSNRNSLLKIKLLLNDLEEHFQKQEQVQSRVRMLEKISSCEVDRSRYIGFKIKISTIASFWTISCYL